MNDNMLSLRFGGARLGKCRYGWMLHDGPYIGRCLELYGEYSESEVSVFKAYVRPGDHVVEVGANIGSLTLPLAHLAGADGRVFAFESQPESFNVLCANLAMNGLKNVKPINAFVATSPDVETASAAWGKYAYVSDTWETTFQSIDSLALRRLDFVKIDVDGSELDVLRSGADTIARHLPVIYFENDLRDRSRELIGWVMDAGYRVFFHPAPIFSPDNHYGNPRNEWAPQNIVSLMMLAVPPGKPVPDGQLREVADLGEWWDITG